MDYINFLNILQFMGYKSDIRIKRIYLDYINNIRLKRIIDEIESSKKGTYYLIEYVIKQKQQNIIGKSLKL